MHTITNARPRESVLNLFDPLSDTAFDKENSYSPFDHDCSVDRALFTHTNKRPSPVLLKRRLIDVGDITANDIVNISTPERSGNPNTDKYYDTDSTITRSKPNRANHTITLDAGFRTPLAELVVDHNMTPLAQTKLYNQQSIPTPPPARPPTSEHLKDSKVACVVNPVDAIERNPMDLKHHRHPQDDDILDRELPQICVTLDDYPASPTSSNKIPTEDALSPSEPFSPPLGSVPLRPNPLNAPSLNSNRHSIDLHSSFQLQFQSEDASFDLLNDKISLFASTNDHGPFLDTEDESEDFATAFEKTIEQNIASKNQREAIQIVAIGGVHADTKYTITPEDRLPPIINIVTQKSPAQGKLQSCSMTQSSQKSQGPSVNPVIPRPFSRLSTKEAINPAEVIQTPALLSRMIKPPPLVPALRIVKRANRLGSDLPGNSAVSTTSLSLANGKPTMSATSVDSCGITIAQKPTAFISHANDRPKCNLATEGNRIPSSSKVNGGPRRILLEDTQNTYPYKVNDGPRRVVVTQTRQTKPKEKHLGVIGPRRVVVTPNDNPPTSATLSKAQSKAPVSHSRNTFAQRNGISLSSLPRPTTRLPVSSTSGLPRPAPNVNNPSARNGTKQRDIRGVTVPLNRFVT